MNIIIWCSLKLKKVKRIEFILFLKLREQSDDSWVNIV